jgi:hypothetical protein
LQTFKRGSKTFCNSKLGSVHGIPPSITSREQLIFHSLMFATPPLYCGKSESEYESASNQQIGVPLQKHTVTV